MVGLIMAGHHLIVFAWLGVLLLTMLVLLRLCICEYAMTIGCWNANVVVDSYFGVETWHHACSHAMFDAALSIPAAACLSQTVSVFVPWWVSLWWPIASLYSKGLGFCYGGSSLHSVSNVDPPKGTLVPKDQLAVVDEVEAKRCSPSSPNYQLSSTFNEDIYGVWFVVFLVFTWQSKRYRISGVAWQLTLSRPMVKKEAANAMK
nr:hypothetical protein [Tanacetum cinerariifolium]